MQDIEKTCLMVFKVCKCFSPRGSTWWNEDCDTVATEVRNAQDLETRKAASKNLQKEVSLAKRNWANDFLHNATPERLWTAAKWRFGRWQRLIPALATDTGLTDQPILMATALRQRFFKTSLAVVPPTFPDNPAPHAPRPHAPITLAEISDALSTTSNKSTPGPSGHNYKLAKWAFSASPTRFQNLFEACLRIGHHPELW
jgi:hypothetical protein